MNNNDDSPKDKWKRGIIQEIFMIFLKKTYYKYIDIKLKCNQFKLNAKDALNHSRELLPTNVKDLNQNANQV